MNLQRCEKGGHYYDADKFASCPHCEASNVQIPMPSTVPFDQGEAGKPTEPVKPNDGGGLTDKIKDAIDNHDNNPAGAKDDQKTISFFATQSGGEEPAVGILLCVDGPSFGKTFLLKTGKNFVGRDASMDVVIPEDKAISREKHAIVLYEPKSKVFIAQPGESRELFYLNDQVVLQAQNMEAYDEITLGNSKLVFVPICGDKFSWDNYKK